MLPPPPRPTLFPYTTLFRSLNAILGFGQLLEMGGDAGRDRESAQHILKAGRHLLALINEVLDIARIEAGRPSIDRKSTRLNSSHSQISYAVFCLKKKKSKH